ncbi:hypothetical protein EGR_10450 [Echinococcus granulosus]|uniref:Uncharacterized protein n=1 Tax=Echinococcus granulosus TaxID=6210 RepID=W6U0W5_ECHGR|nr:hypothetical protein EGR_10450 [Echinococcus granulosus]EUB54688.1 hypothetical protein EGR_10450 [Echinococcus granulosus]
MASPNVLNRALQRADRHDDVDTWTTPAHLINLDRGAAPIEKEAAFMDFVMQRDDRCTVVCLDNGRRFSAFPITSSIYMSFVRSPPPCSINAGQISFAASTITVLALP